MIHLILLAFFIAVIVSWFSEPTQVTVRVVVQALAVKCDYEAEYFAQKRGLRA